MYAYPDVIKFLRTIDDLFKIRSSVAELGQALPLFWVKKKEITEGRKASREIK